MKFSLDRNRCKHINSALRKFFSGSRLIRTGVMVSGFAEVYGLNVKESIGLNNIGYSAKEKILDYLQREPEISKYISKKRLSNTLVGLLQKHKKNYDKKSYNPKAQDIQTFLEIIEIEKHNIIIPIVGLEAQERMQFGPVTFFPASELQKEIASFVSRYSLSDKKLPFFERENLPHTMALCEVTAEPEKARQTGENIIDEALSVLSIFADLEYHNLYKLGFLPDIQPYLHRILILSSTGKTGVLGSKNRLSIFQVSQSKCDKLVSPFSYRLVNRLFLDIIERKASELGERIWTAMVWLGKSLRKKDTIDKFMSAMTSIEAIFYIRGQTTEVVNRVAEGVAFVVGKDKDKRIYTANHIKSLYDIRSTATHTGKNKIRSEDLEELQIWSLNLIINLMNKINVFKSEQDFSKWIEEQKFS